MSGFSRTALRYYFLFWVHAFNLLPDRMKRILFISSIYSKLFNVKETEYKVLFNLNKKLNLSESDYSIGLGIILSDKFWNNKALEDIRLMMGCKNKFVINEVDEKNIALEIIEQTPYWLKYDEDEMIFDLLKLIGLRFELSNSPD